MADMRWKETRFWAFALLVPIGSMLLLLMLVVGVNPGRISAAIAAADRPPVTRNASSNDAPVSSAPVESPKELGDRASHVIDELKERASAQQTLINSLSALTGLYVVVLSIVAYIRLQQTREDTLDAIKRNEGSLLTARTELKESIASLVAEVRLDVPAIHGIGRRLDALLAALNDRLPVDGDWTNRGTYARLDSEDIQQALIDEMVVNSLEIFNVRASVSGRRTVSRLYVRLGQFYFARAYYRLSTEAAEAEAQKKLGTLAERVNPAEIDTSIACLARARAYLRKAVETDGIDPIALRALGVVLMHTAIWKKRLDQTNAYDRSLLSEASIHINRSLEHAPEEPGACIGKAWLLSSGMGNDHNGAIRILSKAIQSHASGNMTHQNARKFLSTLYLNRANYRARQLATLASADPDKRNALAAEIAADIDGGRAAAQAAGTLNQFREDVAAEIEPSTNKPKGDLADIYSTFSDAHQVIASILSGK